MVFSMTDTHKQTACLRINLNALAANYTLLKSKVGDNTLVAGIVKANAYGLGMQPVVRTLLKNNCTHFFVATLNEALAFRKIEPNAFIAVLGGLFIGAEQDYLDNNIHPVINSLDDLSRWQTLSAKQPSALPTILHYDTGMNRLGLSQNDAKTLQSSPERLKNLDIQWVITHFACADEKDHALTQSQAHKFEEFAQNFPTAKRSLGNSPGTFRDVRFHTDMVRPGIALYGGNPTPETLNPMHNVVDLKAKILQIRHCNKGDTIGYGASYKFEKDTITATIAVGYADGLNRSHSNKAIFYYNDTPCPVIGRVSMDLTTIDMTACQTKPAQGDWVEIIGPNQSPDDLAQSANTISYEILTSLGLRYHREYIE